jgi:peroxisomal 3,2-trans-enoyl-CoA isomerase
VNATRPSDGETDDLQRNYLKSFVANNLYLTHTFYTHPKILVVALNGPAIGLSAALTGFADFVYGTPHCYLLTPFTSLGLVSEGNSSIGFVQRLGISKANEALIMSKRLTSEELLQVGYINKIFNFGKDQSAEFLNAVLAEIEDRMGDHLNQDSMLKVKALIRAPQKAALDTQGVLEVLGGLERFVGGYPQEEFRRIASGEKKHKL